MNTETKAAEVVGSSAELGPLPERWYVLDADGLATLCKDEADARESASGYWSLYPRRGPYRAVLLGDLSAERERWKAALRMQHDYKGACPDALQPDARDNQCKACRALLDLGA